MRNYALELHRLFDIDKHYCYDFTPNSIPKNGIYIFFEKDEKFGGFTLHKN